MAQSSHDTGADLRGEQASARPLDVSRVPGITIGAFCDTPEMAGTIELAAKDRLMSRAQATVHTGGIAAAVELHRQSPTPDLIVVESRADAGTLTSQLEALAEVCDAGTKVMVIGYSNDIALYRELLTRGVAEYLVAPLDAASIVASISRVYTGDGAQKLGRVYAFIGAKGGVGSSTIAHNVAWTMARAFASDVILADLDLPFGTAGLDFNLDPAQGIANALFDAGRLDELLLERLLARCDEHLGLLAAPAALERTYDFDEKAFDKTLEIAQSSVASVVLDVPHQWTSWVKRTLLSADEVAITAVPNLANLRNAKNLIDFLKQARPNDAPPRLILNQVGMSKRPEIKPDEFAAALQLEPIARIPFDPVLFGTAENNGQMIAEVSAKAAVSGTFAEVAQIVAGRTERARNRKGSSSLWGFLTRLRARPGSKAKTKGAA